MTFSNQATLNAAHARIQPYIHLTPIHTSELIDKKTQAQLFLKCDNFQKGGSYKIRGAMNAILQLSDEERAKGVATHSSGNFAQALSLAAANAKVPAYIVMPENAPKVKIAAVRDYGGQVILCPSTLQDRERSLAAVVEKTGATKIHPSNDLAVIDGQATMSMELLTQVPDLDYIVVPIGGGGVGAGACLASSNYNAQVKIVGAEPAQASDAFQSLARGEIVPSVNPNTIADGLRTQLGHHNFPIIHKLIDQIILVEEEKIVTAMRLVWERMKLIIEPSSAVTLAAILTKPEVFRDKRVGLIITGGNVSLNELPF